MENQRLIASGCEPVREPEGKASWSLCSPTSWMILWLLFLSVSLSFWEPTNCSTWACAARGQDPVPRIKACHRHVRVQTCGELICVCARVLRT